MVLHLVLHHSMPQSLGVFQVALLSLPSGHHLPRICHLLYKAFVYCSWSTSSLFPTDDTCCRCQYLPSHLNARPRENHQVIPSGNLANKYTNAKLEKGYEGNKIQETLQSGRGSRKPRRLWRSLKMVPESRAWLHIPGILALRGQGKRMSS